MMTTLIECLLLLLFLALVVFCVWGVVIMLTVTCELVSMLKLRSKIRKENKNRMKQMEKAHEAMKDRFENMWGK